jgi:hypothetical protein
MSDQHARFLERVKASAHAVFVIGRLQHLNGWTVEIPGVRLAPTAKDAPMFVDKGDLFLVKRTRLDVKHRDIDFTGREDFPYPTMFVSNVAAVDRAHDVEAYITVSRDFSCRAIITKETRPHWIKVDCLASNTGNIETNYACPIEHVIFKAIPPDLR